MKFAWWYGGLADMRECVSTGCRATILPRFTGQGQVANEIDLLEAPRRDDTLLVRRSRNKKEYIPKKFTYFWLSDSTFNQYFKCEFVIDGRLYNCTEQWMMQQKSIVFGQLELAEKMMKMEHPKAMKRAAQKKGIPNFNQSIWERHSYGILHEGNMQNLAQSLEIYLALKGTVGTMLVEASPYDRIWGCVCRGREDKPAAQQRETWRGLNWLEEILREVRDELMAARGLSEEGDVLAVGLFIEPVTDFGELQRKCPEASIFIDYWEKGTLPTNQKWRRRLEHDAQDFFMKDGKLWQRQESTGEGRASRKQ